MDNKNNGQKAISILCEQIINAIREFNKNNGTHIYNGIVISNGTNGKWNIKYNGKIHEIEHYGTATPTLNKRVKVFIPDGNQSLAFFI